MSIIQSILNWLFPSSNGGQSSSGLSDAYAVTYTDSVEPVKSERGARQTTPREFSLIGVGFETYAAQDQRASGRINELPPWLNDAAFYGALQGGGVRNTGGVDFWAAIQQFLNPRGGSGGVNVPVYAGGVPPGKGQGGYPEIPTQWTDPNPGGVPPGKGQGGYPTPPTFTDPNPGGVPPGKGQGGKPAPPAPPPVIVPPPPPPPTSPGGYFGGGTTPRPPLPRGPSRYI